MQGLMFSVLMTLLGGEEPLEMSVGQLPDGRIVIVALTEGPPNQLHSLVQIQPGDDLSAGNFTHTQFDAGNIFSISPQLVSASGYLYMAAVCELRACMYRLAEGNPTSWQKNADVAGAALGSTEVHSVTLNPFGALLALTLHTPDSLYFMRGDPSLALAALSFTVLNSITGVASPFIGGTKVSTAIDPATQNRCMIYRQLVSAAVIGNLVARCFSGSGPATALATLATLSTAAGFVNSIESRALFHAGTFYFMYFLASGTAQLAALTDPLTAATLVTVQLGLINLATGFPSMSLVLGPAGEYLYAFWPAQAVAISLATLSVQPLAGFPIAQAGPIAALLLLTATLTIAIFGAGSVVGTVMTEGGALQAVPVPATSVTALLVLAVAVCLLAAARQRGIVTISNRRGSHSSRSSRSR